MPAELSLAGRALIESDALAHVVTLDPDGRPHLSLAWVGLEGNEVVFGTLNDQRKLRNLRRDPRIAISIEGTAMMYRCLAPTRWSAALGTVDKIAAQIRQMLLLDR